jgi:hypothetical protein
MRVIPRREAAYGGDLVRRILQISAPQFTVVDLLSYQAGLPANGAWPSANKPLVLPFAISQAFTVREFGWRNGSGTMTDSFDIGIYSTGLVRLISGGGTARSGANAWQWVDVTDTTLAAGRYYLAMANSGTTANQAVFSSSWTAAILSLYGVLDSATNAYPLPDPLTNLVAAATFVRFPVVAIAGIPHYT